MGYSIYIGEYKVTPPDPEFPEDGEYICVEDVECDDAPTFLGDGMTGHSNSRHPSYGGWSDFAWEVGLHDFFFDQQTGLMREHPGTFDLEKSHLLAVQEALVEYRKEYPHIKPRFGASDVEANLARLIWLAWWIEWTLANCKRPSISNH